MYKKISIFTLYVILTSFYSFGQYLVNSKTLNMRVGPGINFEVAVILSYKEEVKLINNYDNTWLEVEARGIQGFVYANHLIIDPQAGWMRKEYKTGVTPECENVVPEYDYSINNYLKVNVGSSTDVVVKLMRIEPYGDKCIRIVYVRSGDVYKIENIPEGKYYLKIAYGKDYRQKIIDNTCYVKFMKNAQYEKGSEILDYYKVKKPDRILGDKVYESWSIPSFEISLDVVAKYYTGRKFNSNGISETDFNR